jgi:hypothetical protein
VAAAVRIWVNGLEEEKRNGIGKRSNKKNGWRSGESKEVDDKSLFDADDRQS